jgi:hypothetical protein
LPPFCDPGRDTGRVISGGNWWARVKDRVKGPYWDSPAARLDGILESDAALEKPLNVAMVVLSFALGVFFVGVAVGGHHPAAKQFATFLLVNSALNALWIFRARRRRHAHLKTTVASAELNGAVKSM